MSNIKLHIKNATVVDPHQNREGLAQIYIDDNKIVDCSFGEKIDPDFKADKVYENKLVIPSIVDNNVHLKEQRSSNFETEVSAAAYAGIGHLLCVPSYQPCIDKPALAQSIIEKAKDLKRARVYPIGAISQELRGKQLSEMKSLMGAGCIALSNHYQSYDSLNVLIRCYEYAASFDIPVIIYPMMPSLYRQGGVHEGSWSARLGLPGIPESAETIAIATHLLLIEQSGVKAHFSQLSCAKSVEQIAQAKSSGLQVSADVAAHQLFLTDECLANFDSNYHVCPPLREAKDNQALIEGLKSGVIDSICSSHQPHEMANKNLPFQASEPGISALETLVPLAGKLAEKELSLMNLVSCLSKNPANCFAIPQEGIIKNTEPDLCIIDTNANWQLTEDKMMSKGKNSPFLGETFKWKVEASYINGQFLENS